MKIIWSPLAIDRVAEIANYIAKDKPTAAEKWVDKIFSKVEGLISSPKLGRLVPEINKDQYREVIYGNYRIVYRIEEKRISILTVRHGKSVHAWSSSACFLRMYSPLICSLVAVCKSLSRMASASVGSPIASCQCATVN